MRNIFYTMQNIFCIMRNRFRIPIMQNLFCMMRNLFRCQLEFMFKYSTSVRNSAFKFRWKRSIGTNFPHRAELRITGLHAELRLLWKSNGEISAYNILFLSIFFSSLISASCGNVVPILRTRISAQNMQKMEFCAETLGTE